MDRRRLIILTKELQPTYGNFTLRGQVVWKDRQNAHRTGETSSGSDWQALEFGVKTSDKNIVAVNLFSTKFDKVKLKNKETKKLDKEVDYGNHTGELPEGYELFMPLTLGLEKDNDGNNIKERLIQYDAISYINENLNNGDTVFLFGSPRFSEYTDKDGNKTPKVEFEPRGIFKSTVDYDEDGFTSESTFEQKIILRNTELDKKNNNLQIDAYIITNKKGEFVPHKFYIDVDKYKDFALNVHKLKFGTILSVEGIIHHTVEEKEVVINDGWGESPTGNAVTTVKRSLEITKAVKPSKEDVAYYSKEDFVKEKPQDKKENNPFEEESSEDTSWGESSSSSVDDSDPFA